MKQDGLSITFTIHADKCELLIQTPEYQGASWYLRPAYSMPCSAQERDSSGVIMQVGISVNIIFLVVGIVVSSAVPPLAFLLTWRKVPCGGAAITSAIAGQIAGIIAWLVHTQIVYGVITQDTAQVSKHTAASILFRLKNVNPSRIRGISQEWA